MTELGGLVAGAISALLFSGIVAPLVALVFLLTLQVLAVIDLRTGYLPDMLTLPLIALGIVAGAADLFVPFGMAALGAGLGFAAFAVVGAVYKRWRGVDGLGGGDAKLLAAIGAFTGAIALPGVVMIAASTALCAVAIAGRGKMDPRAEIRFGPYLAAGGAIMFLSGALVPGL